MKLRKFALFIVMLLGLQASALAQAVLFSDNFSDGNMTGWSVVDQGTISAPSAWSVVAGEVQQSSNIYGPDVNAVANRKGTFAYYNNGAAFSWNHYSFSTKLRSTDDDGIGVMFRYVNANNYYKIDLDAQRSFRKLFKVVNGVETTLATAAGGYTTGTSFILKVTVSGNKIWVTMDGNDVFGGPVTDGSLSAGTVALYCWGSQNCYFDDVSVVDATLVADAGVDQSVTDSDGNGSQAVVLNGAGSQDLNGSIVSYVWKEGATQIATGANPSVTLGVGSHTITLTVTDNQSNTQTDTVKVDVASNNTFTIALLPDTQIYAMSYPAIFNSQTQWLADNAAAKNIKFVIHLGDITNNNNTTQWPVAQGAMRRMDGVVPYSVTPGNHDIGSNGSSSTRDTTLYNQYFPLSWYSGRPTFGGVYPAEPTRYDNNYHLFSAGGTDWLVLSLEFGPRGPVIDWAKQVIAAHPNHRVIIATHAYMYYDETRLGTGDSWNPHGYGIANEVGGTNDGEELWTKLAKLYPNVTMVVNGHVLNDGQGRLVSTGDNGNKVYQMLSNYQMQTNGGNGYLRLLKIDPVLGKISATSYSPYLNQYKTDAENQFEFTNVALGPPTSYASLLNESFDDGNYTGWTVVNEGTIDGPSVWAVTSGKLVQSSNIYGPDVNATANRKGTFAYYNNAGAMAWTNYALQTTLRSSDDDGIGVMVRYQNPSNYYKIEIDKQRNFRKLFKVKNGVETVLATTAGAYTQNADLVMQVTVNGNQISATLGGVDILGGTITDSDLSSGSVALYCWGNQNCTYDDVTVNSR
ncbi:MAG TPA: metallophosphoesterase [Ramlibacter sp.]|nr:metallophosphoesterase [Ramlibacter sp.]